MAKAGCQYCDRDEAMAAVGVEVAKLSASTLYFFREQSHPGRCILASGRHLSDPMDLEEGERKSFFDDLVRAAGAIKKVFRPDKINYAAFGDKSPHLHFHLVPKYRDGFEWGDVFAMNPRLAELTEPEYAEAVEKLKRAL
ncbi:MAG: HIT family protein [Planctomycetota bacterium]|jgi:diadenosine tetraphosphate (Ap4A) HIT family hydrolase|nr:HIT family protein [Planctomycetota bacterium]